VEVVRALHYSPGGLGAAVKRDLILQVRAPYLAAAVTCGVLSTGTGGSVGDTGITLPR
jgi:hypothetical protein